MPAYASRGSGDQFGIKCGDTVTFDDRDGRNIMGLIVRINQRTARIGTGTADGGTWRVPLHMLRHVLDI